jgi:LDH2 family malate/lactate/ureidoglycolate dehydrogenase
MGTNPICMAVPGPKTFLLDMATTTVALNKIHKAIRSGETSIPPGWAMDADGRPTTDPQVAIQGLPMPLGGYKGTGLALMVEILCSVLSGGPMLTEVGGLWERQGPMRASQFFFAIDVARFLPLGDFAARMQFVRDTVKNMAPALGFEEVLIAGDPEWRAEEIRRRDGVPIASGIWTQLVDLGVSLKVEAPAMA